MGLLSTMDRVRVDVPNLGRDIAWDSTPCRLKVGDIVTDGDIGGTIHENGFFKTHYITVPPNMDGSVFLHGCC